MTDVRVTRPALRFHGGKWLLAPWIIAHFPPHIVYVEPFGGGASVLLRKERSRAEVYNDLDDNLVTLFRVLRDRVKSKELLRRLRLTPFARAEFDEAYEPSEDPVETARRLIIRSLMGFGTNGHQRRTGFRSKGYRAGQLPQDDWRNYPDALSAIIQRLRAGVVIEHGDATSVMARYDEVACLHYVDPPYVAESRDPGRDYHTEMTARDHDKLLSFLPTLQGMVVLSGYPSDRYDSALAGWRRVERDSLADGARPRIEVLWINPAAADALDDAQLPLFAGEKA